MKPNTRIAACGTLLALAFAMGPVAAQPPADSKSGSAPGDSKPPIKKRSGGGGFIGALEGMDDDGDENLSDKPKDATPSPGSQGNGAPSTGIASMSIGRPDGSHLTYHIDDQGNLVDTEAVPPAGVGGGPIKTTIDPATGISTTVATGPDGKQAVITTNSQTQPDGSEKVTVSDDQGNTTEGLIHPDGRIDMNQSAASGTRVTSRRNPDGSLTVTETRPDGGSTETRRTADGRIIQDRFDPQGNLIETVTQSPDGELVSEDYRGNVHRVSFRDGGISESYEDRFGAEDAGAPGGIKEPGQPYYEGVVGGRGWDALDGGDKTAYADAEAEVLAGGGSAVAKTDKPLTGTDRLEAEFRKASEESRAKMNAELAAIDAEQAEADRKAETRISREERQRRIEESRDISKQLQADYDAAVASGDMDKAYSIMKQQDAHHEASHDLLALNDEERAKMEDEQKLRDEMVAKVSVRARLEAERKASEDWQQDLKESVTKGLAPFVTGAQTQQDTAAATRLANLELARSQEVMEGLRKQLADPNLSPAQRRIAESMLRMASAQAVDANETLADNTRLTAAGYAIDGISMLGGGPLKKVATGTLGKLVGTAGEKAVSELGLVAAKRIVGRDAAQVLSSHASAIADRTRAAANALSTKAGAVVNRVANAVPGGALVKTDAAKATAKWLGGVVEESARDAAFNATQQLVTEGTIDPEDIAVSSIAGTLAGRAAGHVAGRFGKKPSVPGEIETHGSGPEPSKAGISEAPKAASVEPAPHAVAAAPKAVPEIVGTTSTPHPSPEGPVASTSHPSAEKPVARPYQPAEEMGSGGSSGSKRGAWDPVAGDYFAELDTPTDIGPIEDVAGPIPPTREGGPQRGEYDPIAGDYRAGPDDPTGFGPVEEDSRPRPSGTRRYDPVAGDYHAGPDETTSVIPPERRRPTGKDADVSNAGKPQPSGEVPRKPRIVYPGDPDYYGKSGSPPGTPPGRNPDLGSSGKSPDSSAPRPTPKPGGSAKVEEFNLDNPSDSAGPESQSKSNRDLSKDAIAWQDRKERLAKAQDEVLAKVQGANKIASGIHRGDENCLSAAMATDQRLSGEVPDNLKGGSQALPSIGPDRGIKTSDAIEMLEHRYQTEVEHLGSGQYGRGQVERAMRNPGDRAIVMVDLLDKNGEWQGHAFNVVNHEGHVVFVDGQSGRIVHPKWWNGKRNVRLLRTNY